MKTSDLLLAACIAALSLTATRMASAQSDRETPRDPSIKPVGLEGGSGFEAATHAGLVHGDAGGLLVGGTLLLRHGPINFGGVVERSMFIGATNTYAGLAGVSVAAGRWRTKLLASSGLHEYTGVGAGLLDDDPGANGSAVFVGGRLMPSYRFFSGGTHLEVGGLVLYEADLSRRTVDYTYQESQEDWFSGGSSDSIEREESQTIGGHRYGVALSVSVSHDVF